MHHVFNTPEDKIIWDVGHQAYIHKILTGRRSKMSTIRQQGGLSGACHRFRPFQERYYFVVGLSGCVQSLLGTACWARYVAWGPDMCMAWPGWGGGWLGGSAGCVCQEQLVRSFACGRD
jgi:hypothetical protein